MTTVVNVLGVSGMGDVLLLLPAVVKDAAEKDLDGDCNDEKNDSEDNEHYPHKVDASLEAVVVVGVVPATGVIVELRNTLLFCPVAGEEINDEADVGEKLEDDKDHVDVVNHLAGLDVVWFAKYDQCDCGKRGTKGKWKP